MTASDDARLPREGLLSPGGHIGPYRVLQHLGSGRIADVYAVAARDSREEFALKLIRPHLLADPNFVSRFGDTARRLIQLQHPNLPRVYSVELGQPHAYLLMEWIHGTPLTTQLTEPSLDERAAPIYRQIAAALSAAHESSPDHCLVHGALSPDHILLCPQDGDQPPLVKVLGLGMAALFDRHRPNPPAIELPTPANVLRLAYAPPEQLGRRQHERAPLTPQSDQFSLAAIIYEMLRGRPAFCEPGDDAETIRRRVLHEDEGALFATPRRLEELHKALHKIPYLRHDSVSAFVDALWEPPVSMADTIIEFSSPIPPKAEPVRPISQDPTQPRPRWYSLLPAALAGILVMLGASISYRHWHHQPPQQQPIVPPQPLRSQPTPQIKPAQPQPSPSRTSQDLPPIRLDSPTPHPPRPLPPRPLRYSIVGASFPQEQAIRRCVKSPPGGEIKMMRDAGPWRIIGASDALAGCLVRVPPVNTAMQTITLKR